MGDARLAAPEWRTAKEALDGVCRALADVPGAGDQYEALCRLTREYQRAAGRLVGATARQG